jgi:hypothetical protein
MAFMTLNGISVPVADGGIEETQPDLSPGTRAFDGTYRTRRKRPKRAWTVNTRRMATRDASILESTVLGHGDVFRFDGTVYSVGGLRPRITTTPKVAFLPSVAADGFPAPLLATFGQSVAVRAATTNLLASNQRNLEAGTTVGFTAIDAAALASENTLFYESLRSLRVQTSAAVNGINGGVKTNGVAATAATTHAGSFYAFSVSGTTIRARLFNVTTATAGAYVTQVLAANTWTRVIDCVLAGVAVGNSLELQIEENTADAGIIFFLDALQIESGTQSSHWVDGTATTDSLQVNLGTTLGAYDSLTVSFWATGKQLSGSRDLFTIDDSVGTFQNYMQVSAFGADSISVLAWDSTGLQYTATVAGIFTTFATRHVALVYQSKPTGGAARLSLYVAGVLVASDVTLGAFDLSLMSRLNFGSNSRFSRDDFALLPYAMTAAEVAAIAASTTPIKAGPALELAGDCIPEASVLCYGDLGPSKYATGVFSGAYDNAAREVTFTLQEI